MRNALLEDHNFDWSTLTEPRREAAPTFQYWWLYFGDPDNGKILLMAFSEDCGQVERAYAHGVHDGTSISTEPIAAGLREMFDEFSAKPDPAPAEPSR